MSKLKFCIKEKRSVKLVQKEKKMLKNYLVQEHDKVDFKNNKCKRFLTNKCIRICYNT